MKTKLIIGLIVVAVIVFGFHQYLHHRDEEKGLTVFGNVDIREVDLGFRVTGKIDKMNFEEGGAVKQGDVLAELDKTPFLDQVNVAKAEVQARQAILQNAQRSFKRSKDLFDKGSGSAGALDDATAALHEAEARLNASNANLDLVQTSLQDTELFSPSEGVILNRIHEVGAIVRLGEPVYTLSLINPVKIRSYVTEPQLGKIYPGMKAKVMTDSGKTYIGHIGFISPQAEFTPKTVETQSLRTDLVYRFRIIVDNPDHGLRQGMPVTIQLIEHV